MNILITGCSRGIGRGLVESYLTQTQVNKIFAISQHVDSLKPLAEKFPERLILFNASVSERSSKPFIEKLLEPYSLDLLINNAGIYVEEPENFAEISVEVIRKSFEVNLFAAFLTTQACLKALQRSQSPKVVQMTSLMGSIKDNTSGGSYGYRISKAALNMFNKSFSIDYPEVISIVMHPGWVQTEMGGTQAPVTIANSVSGIISRIEGLKKSDSGKFFDFEGDELPW